VTAGDVAARGGLQLTDASAALNALAADTGATLKARCASPRPASGRSRAPRHAAAHGERACGAHASRAAPQLPLAASRGSLELSLSVRRRPFI
jgi:hypothetical protein